MTPMRPHTAARTTAIRALAGALLVAAAGCGNADLAGPSLVFDSVVIQRPQNGFTLLGVDTVEVQVTGRQAPRAVQLLVDGAVVRADSTAPWVFAWDTGSLTEGSQHRLEAAAVDSAGRSLRSTPVTVTIGRRTFTGNYGLFTVNADGTNLKEILPLDFLAVAPDLTPDGTRIVFTGITQDLDGNGLLLPGGDDRSAEIYLANADGSGLLQRTANSSIESDTRWTPDGIAILFSTDRIGNREIFWDRVYGGGPVVNRTLTPGYAERYPSQYGQLIYHTRFAIGADPGVGAIWTVHESSRDMEQVTNPAVSGTAPSWLPLGDLGPDVSPDGTELAFSRSFGGAGATSSLGKALIIVRGLSDSIEVNLGGTTGADLFPRWSPDGTTLLATAWDASLPSGGSLVMLNPATGARTVVGPLPANLRPIQATWFHSASLVVDGTPDILFAGAKSSLLE